MRQQAKPGDFPGLTPGLMLTRLEAPSLYDARNDELYELTEEAFQMLGRCDGSRTLAELALPDELLAYCMQEGLLEMGSDAHPRPVPLLRNELPSLRYLMVEITERCNLRCRHCYLGEAGHRDMDIALFERLAEAFGKMGGLRLIVTGGEPLLHPSFERLNAALPALPCRAVLATNGTLLERDLAARLNFREVQISLDGMRDSHNALRGDGSFEAALRGCEAVRSAGLDLSIATMIHTRNLDELPALETMVQKLMAVAWALDIPVETGRLAANPGFLPELSQAVPYLDLRFGEGVHEQGGSGGCGAHLACINVGGSLLKCGYYRELSGGSALPDLRRAWREVPRTGIPSVCADCEFVADCGGGCRFRAERLGGPDSGDRVRCLQFGLEV